MIQLPKNQIQYSSYFTRGILWHRASHSIPVVYLSHLQIVNTIAASYNVAS
jgi:hypothetical protein